MAFDDVSVDSVNVDQVNRSNWVRVQMGSTCQRHWVIDQWVPRVRFNQKKKKKKGWRSTGSNWDWVGSAAHLARLGSARVQQAVLAHNWARLGNLARSGSG